MKAVVLSGVVVIGILAAAFAPFTTKDEASSVHPVRLERVRLGNVRKATLANGKIIAQAKRIHSAPIAGIVHDGECSLGQHVSRGMTIARMRLPEPELRRKSQELEYALLDLNAVTEQVNQYESLLQEKATSLNEVKQLRVKKLKQERYVENLREDVAEKSIVAELDGVIVEKPFRSGDRVMSGTTLATVVDTASFAVEFQVGQDEVLAIAVGDQVSFKSNTFVGEREGRIVEVGRIAASPASGSYDAANDGPKVSVVAGIFCRPADNLLLGSSVDVYLNTIERTNVVFVPLESILHRADTTIVFVNERGTVRTRAVNIGIWNADVAEIIDGVDLGDSVVTAGNLDLQEGSRITSFTESVIHGSTKRKDRSPFALY